MSIEKQIAELGLDLLDYARDGYPGTAFGPMKSHHLIGKVLHLSGQVPVRDGRIVHPGRLGSSVSLQQGYEAARLTGLNSIAGMKYALGELEQVKAIIKCLCFVACEPYFTDVHKVSTGLSDILREVLGDDIGIACRATIGVQTLADNICFETWMEVEVR